GRATVGGLQSPTPAQSADGGRVAALIDQATALQRASDAGNGNHWNEIVQLLSPALNQPLEPAQGAEVEWLVASAFYRLDDYPHALDHYQRAIAAYHTTGNRPAEARTLRAVGQLQKNKGAYAEGLAVCDQALAIYRGLDDARNAGLTLVVMGAIRDLMGDHQLALESYHQALPALEPYKDGNTGNLFNEIGITEKNLGHYVEARRAYERALEIYTALNDRRRTVYTLLNLGVLESTLGEYAQGVAYSERALTLARDTQDRRAERILLENLGSQYWELGDRKRALASLEQTLPLVRDMGAKSDEAGTLKTLGDIHVELGDYTLARTQYADALRIQREIGERRTEGSTLMAIAELDVREGQTAEARRTADEALTVATGTGRPELLWMAHRTVANAARASGDTPAAIAELRKSAGIINDLRANIGTDSGKIAFVDRRQSVFQDLATLLVESGRMDEALETAEAGRARAFADLLAQRTVTGKSADRAALSAVRVAQGELGDAGPTPADASLAKKRAAALDSSLAGLTADHRELASLLTAETPTAASIKATAGRLRATIIEYLVTDRRLLAWVVSPDGAIHGVAIDATLARLESLTKTVRSAIDAADEAALARAHAVDEPLRALNGLLIAPLAAWLPANPDASVVVIPHGPLALLPFAALEDDRGQPLAARHTLSFAPAASVFAYTQDKVPGNRARAGATLIVADPDPPAGSGIEHLPWAREEGRRVAARLQGTDVRTLAGPDASEAAVKHDAGAYAVLHFATHGLIAPDRPLASSLMLAAGGGEDGYLRVDEIFGLDLAARLVVLSGCSTGLGRLSGDGILGLSRAFIYAGTPAVVVSQWDISDRATAFLMDHFYTALRQGQSTAAALRAAQLATRERYPHPALWGAFTLVGEPR
ncbi:MAG TPA: CHAT domain-containing protein, partial [Vicinamibacterales bacterium]|nr:CHAT domain-containing protein [Vicinamibacterales bacterium]